MGADRSAKSEPVLGEAWRAASAGGRAADRLVGEFGVVAPAGEQAERPATAAIVTEVGSALAQQRHRALELPVCPLGQGGVDVLAPDPAADQRLADPLLAPARQLALVGAEAGGE